MTKAKDDRSLFIKPQAKATVTDVPGQVVATIETVGKTVEPGMAVDVGRDVPMVVEQVFGTDDSRSLVYVLVRRPSMWVFNTETTAARIQGWPDELMYAIPQLRALKDKRWTQSNVTRAIGSAVGTSISVVEVDVRSIRAVLDSVMDVRRTDRSGEWRIEAALAKIGGTQGF